MTAALAWTPPRSAISQNFDGLLDGLVSAKGIADLADDRSAADFLDAPGHAVVMFVDEPDRVPESWDLAVIFPELLRTLVPPVRGALVRPGRVRRVEQYFGVRRLPALVFVRGGAWLGTIDGLRDWTDYLGMAQQLLLAEPSAPPSAGAPVQAAAVGPDLMEAP